MDYLNGLPVDYPKWTTLKFMIKRNSDFEFNFNSARYNPNEDAVDLIKPHHKRMQYSCDFTKAIPTFTTGPFFLTK